MTSFDLEKGKILTINWLFGKYKKIALLITVHFEYSIVVYIRNQVHNIFFIITHMIIDFIFQLIAYN